MANHEHRFGDEEPSSPPDKLPAPDEAGPTGPNPESSQTKRQDHDIKNARLLGRLVTDLVAEPPLQKSETGDRSRTRADDSPAPEPPRLDTERAHHLIVGGPLDTQLDRQALAISLNTNRGARLKPSELVQAQAIYDQLEGPDRELIARRFGFDGYQSHTYKEIEAVFGHSGGWAAKRTRRLIAGEPVDKLREARFSPHKLDQALTIYDQLEGQDRELIARRFGFDGYQPHTLRDLGVVFGRGRGWAEDQTRRLIAGESVDKLRGASLKPSELAQAQAIYDQLEGQDRELIARRFGFDGYQPHTLRDLGVVFGHSRGWAEDQPRRLIVGEPSDTQLDRQATTVSLDASRGARFSPQELDQAQAIYDQLEGPDRELIARRFGFDGYQPHTHKEIGAVFGCSRNWARIRTRRLIANEPVDKLRRARLQPSELVQAQAIYDRLEGSDRELIARRFGFDGYQPHTYKEIEAMMFGRSEGWARYQTRRLIASESLDPGFGHKAKLRLEPKNQARARDIYDQLEGQPRELIARRFGFDGHDPQAYREIDEAFGRSTNWSPMNAFGRS